MRIVQVANFVRPKSGGIGTVLTELRDRYEGLGHDVVGVLPRSGVPEFDNSDSSRICVGAVRLPFSGGYRMIIRRREVARILDELRPDVVEIHDTSSLFWLPAWCRSRGIPSVVFSHERTDLAVRNAPFGGWILRVLLGLARTRIEENCDSIVCASHFAAAEYDGAGPKVRVIPLGVDLAVFVPSAQDRDWSHRPRIVMCSRLSREKGVDVAVEGFLEFSRLIPSTMRVLGDGPLRQKLEDRCSGEDIEFLGHVSDRDVIASELRSADIVLNMGPFETFGLATLEALACGTPVVVANTGASAELVDAGVGATCDLSAHAIASATISLLSCDRIRLSRNARSRAEEFSWSDTVDKMLTLTWRAEMDTGATPT